MFDIADRIKEDKDKESIKIDRALRPTNFLEYIGQKDLISRLEIAIKASKERGDPLGHILLTGPPGLGKTSMAHVVANESEVKIKSIVAPNLKTTGDLLEIVTKHNKRDILFIDEIHSLSSKVEESLYSVMEDFCVSYKLGNKEIINIQIEPFCLIGATTCPRKVNSSASRSF